MKPASLLVPASAALIALFMVGLSAPLGAKHAPRRFDLVEATIPSIQEAIDDHVITAEQLVRMYHKRIAVYDGPQTATRLNAYIHVNARALDEADDRDHDGDRDRGEGRRHHALAGIPMILKDNIDTRDMPTTAGSLAFEGSFPRSDAFVARKLREAGAIILGKATMTEFANFLTNGMPAGYSSLGGYGFNPYDPRPDPRMAFDALQRPFNDGRPTLTPGGSSSGPGIAVAANLAAVGDRHRDVRLDSQPGDGERTRGHQADRRADQPRRDHPDHRRSGHGRSARANGDRCRDRARGHRRLRSERSGDQGVSDAWQVLQGLHALPRRERAQRRAHCRPAIPRQSSDRDEQRDRGPSRAGRVVETRTVGLAPQLGGCPSRPPAANYPPADAVAPALRCSTVLNYGFKRDLNQYIHDHVRHSFPIQSLEDVVNFNAAHMPAATKYDQDLAIFSQLFDLSSTSADTARYIRDRAEDIVRSRGAIAALLDGVDGMPGTDDDFDAFLASGNNLAGTPAKAGYPSIVVPGGTFQNVVDPPFPVGFDAKDGPAGVTFSGRAFSEPRLIGLAYAFEQATHFRFPPASAPALPSDTVIKH